jgi:hypothetical protein
LKEGRKEGRKEEESPRLNDHSGEILPNENIIRVLRFTRESIYSRLHGPSSFYDKAQSVGRKSSSGHPKSQLKARHVERGKTEEGRRGQASVLVDVLVVVFGVVFVVVVLR